MDRVSHTVWPTSENRFLEKNNGKTVDSVTNIEQLSPILTLKASKIPLIPPNFLLIQFTNFNALALIFLANSSAFLFAALASASAFLLAAKANRRAFSFNHRAFLRAFSANHRAFRRAASANRCAAALARLNVRLPHLFILRNILPKNRRFLSWWSSS